MTVKSGAAGKESEPWKSNNCSKSTEKKYVTIINKFIKKKCLIITIINLSVLHHNNNIVYLWK